MSTYVVDIQTTAGPWPPDVTPQSWIGYGSSHVWCRVTRGNESTGWVECLACPSMHRARALFDVALETYGDVGEDVAGAFLAVTGITMVLAAVSGGARG